MSSTEKLRQSLLADIAGHPKESPSLDELDHVNPEVDEEQIEVVLDDLIDDELVELREFGADEAYVLFPNRFYALTDKGRTEVGDEIEAWKRAYQSVEKDGRIEIIKTLERP